MKQKEKIDLIIQWLYDRRHDNQQPVELRGIIKELGIFESEPELRLIAESLTHEKRVEVNRISSLYTSVKIAPAGIAYIEEGIPREGEQPDKIDVILKWLCARRHKGGFSKSLDVLMKELDIYESTEEVEGIADELEARDLVKFSRVEYGGGFIVGLAPNGIQYCIGAPPSSPAQSVTNIFNKEVYNAVIGNNNSNFEQTTINNERAQELVGRVKDGIKSSREIDEKQKAELLEFVKEINEKIQAQKTVSRFSWSTLLSNTANLAQVAGPALQLAELLGYMPPMSKP